VRVDVHGILLLDKPLGLTSAAAVARVKHLFGANKVGHMGSLDPLATGLLAVGLGEATKFGAHLLDADKTYRVSVRLGERTPSADRETTVCERAPVPVLDAAQVRERLAAFPRRYAQVPPMHSALKKNGKPLYALARAGVTIAREPRPVSIHDLRLLAWEPPELHFEVSVSKGTYIRVLAEDIAASLSTLGHLSALRRLAVAPFDEPAMQTLEALENLEPSERCARLLPVDAALGAFPIITLDAARTAWLAQGRAVATRDAAAGTSSTDETPACPEPASAPGVVRIYDSNGCFLGLGELDAGGLLAPRRLRSARDA